MAMRLTELLEQIPADVEAIVSRTRNRTRAVLQEALRSECRLSMRTPQEADEHRAGARVPVHVVAGYPVHLEEPVFDWDTELLRTLTAYRSSLLSTQSGTDKLLEMFRNNESMINLWVKTPIQETKATLEFTNKCLDFLKKRDPIQKVLDVDSDILGMYIYDIDLRFPERVRIENRNDAEIPHEDTAYNLAKIHLYWAVIGLIARWAGWKVEDLTVVVLAHELAHAYTQLGADIDGRRWPAIVFSNTETGLKEGLAQYYTDRVLRRLQQKFEGALNVFEELIKRQPVAYSVHENWKGFAPEAVRLAMLQTRRRRETSLEGFEKFLESAQDQMRGLQEIQGD